jgi:Carboxypeptidase regulatory-like domain
MKSVIRIICLAFVMLCVSAAINAATFTVNSLNDIPDLIDGDGECRALINECTFRAAIDEANTLPGDDTIILPAGTFTQMAVASNEDNNVDGDWDIRSNITITGAGANLTILQTNAAPNTGSERVLHSVLSTNVVTITGVTIRNGVRSAAATSDDSRGGGIYNNGTLTLNNSVVTSNTTNGGGAGIQNFGNITLNSVTVSGNRCDSVAAECYGGGMLSFFKSTKNITIVDSTFNNNYVKAIGSELGIGYAYGAGMALQTTGDAGTNLNILDSNFTNNTGEGFGTNTNLGGGKGGGIYVRTSGTSVTNISNTVVRANRIFHGFNEIGGGIYLESGAGMTGIWERLTVADNSANNFGNGIYITATANPLTAIDIRYSTISGNTPQVVSGAGGGIAVRGDASTNLTVNFFNTTISGNRNAFGGGAYIASATSNARVTANFNFCTIVNNQVISPNNGVVMANTGPLGSVNLKNTVIANTTLTGDGSAGPDTFGLLVSQDYNHIENTGTATIALAAHDVTGSDPLLGALADNGGPTLTHRPANNSPVVNAIPFGQGGCGDVENTFDQRLLARPNDGTSCDKGSVELNSGPYDLSGTVRTSGGMPIRNAVVILQGGNLPQPVYYLTNNFGLYLFPDLAPGAYTVSISSKRYTFDPQPLNLQSDQLAIDFTALPESRMSIDFQILPRASDDVSVPVKNKGLK